MHRVVYNRRNLQARDMRVPWGGCRNPREVAVTPREVTKELKPSLSIAISIVNPKFSFSVSGTINDQPVMFLVDTGSVLTRALGRDVRNQINNWYPNFRADWLVLHVFGPADVTLNSKVRSLTCVWLLFTL